MKFSVPVFAALAFSGVLFLSGCQTNSHRCVNGKCQVTVNGAGQDLEIKDIDVLVTQISEEGILVSAGGSMPTMVRNGEAAPVGPVTIRVTSIEGQKVKFDLE